jgi:type I restriction enzyme S subunit
MNLPEGWASARLDQVADVILGQSPPGSSYNGEGVGLPFFQGKAEFGSLRPVIRKWTSDPKKVASSDDVLLSVRAPVGPTNLAPCDCSIGRGLAAIHPLGDIDPRYILWGLRATEVVLARGATGTTFGAVSGSQVRAHALPLAPLREQRRIVAAIEEALSRLDAAEESLRRGDRRLRALRAAAVEQSLDGAWPMVPIGDVGADRRHALAIGPFGSNLKTSDYRQEGVSLVFVRNIRAKSFGGEGARFISASKARELAAHTVREGDVLVTKMGDPPGDATVYPQGSPDAVITADCIKITASADYDPHFLALAITSRGGRRQVLTMTKGVAQKKVSLARFKRLEIPAPPLEEQRRIVAEVERQVSLTNALSEAVDTALRRSVALRRSILERAFSGQLVPQDSSDESASVLLERLADDRAARGPTRRRKTVA